MTPTIKNTLLFYQYLVKNKGKAVPENEIKNHFQWPDHIFNETRNYILDKCLIGTYIADDGTHMIIPIVASDSICLFITYWLGKETSDNKHHQAA